MQRQAGLFSAVVTAFLIQTADKLEPDYVQLSSSILYEILVVQRAFVNGSAVDLDPVVSSPNALDFSPPHSQLWINGLWYTSLSLSLITALVAVLAKQWLHQYMSMTSGTPLHRSLLRQFRYEGLQAWRVPLIIGLLPLLMHLSLGIFFIGLIIFLAQLYPACAYVVGLFALIAYSAYFTSHILSAAHPQCPYKTPLSSQLYVLFRPFFSPKGRPASGRSIKEAEEAMVVKRQNNKFFSVDVLGWVFANSTNPSARSIILQSFAGFPKHFHNALHTTFKRPPLGVETDYEFAELFRPLVSVLEAPPNDPFNAQSAYALLERLVRTDNFVVCSGQALLLNDVLPTHPTVPLELVAAIASKPARIESSLAKLQAKEVFLNPEYLPTHLDLRLHPQTWIDLVIRILNPYPCVLSEDDVRNGSSALLPIIQLCANSPSLLDLYNTTEFQLLRGGLREFPVPFDESAVTFRRVCQVPAFRKMVDQSLYRIFHAYDHWVNSGFEFRKYPGLRVRLAIVKYYVHLTQGGCSSADPEVVSELRRLVINMLRDMYQKEYRLKEEGDGFIIYYTLQSMLTNKLLPADPKHLKLYDKPRHLALLFMASFLQQTSVYSYVDNFPVYSWDKWFSVPLLKQLLLLCYEEVEDRTDLFDYLWPGILLLARGLFQCVPAAYDAFPEADLLRVLAPFRYYPTVFGAVCYYIQSTFYWTSTNLTSEEQSQQRLPRFMPNLIPDVDVHRKYLFRTENVVRICTFLLSAPESSWSRILGMYASPRTQIIEFLGLFWTKGEMELTWPECRALLRADRERSYDISLYPVFGHSECPSTIPTVTDVKKKVAYLDAGIDLLDRHIDLCQDL